MEWFIVLFRSETGYSDDIILGLFYPKVDESMRKLLQEFDVIIYDVPGSISEFGADFDSAKRYSQVQFSWLKSP